MTDHEPELRSMFFSLVAQHDNLGDLVIRKVAFDLLRVHCDNAQVLTEGVPQDFVDAFEFGPDDTLHSTRASFRAALVAKAVKGRAWLILSPGPQHVAPGLRGYLSVSAGVARNAVMRSSGNRVSALGRSVLGVSNPRHLRVERVGVAATNEFIARDHPSVEMLRSRKVSWAPDVAFASSQREVNVTAARDYIAFSFRSDSRPDEAGLGAALEVCRDRGLTPVFVSQVARDDPQHASYASEYGVDAFLWGNRSHADQLSLVRKVYDRCVATVSNRLHVLILGATAGASPIVFSDSPNDKARITLDGVLDAISIDSSFDAIDNAIDNALDPATLKQLSLDVARARSEVLGVAGHMSGRLVS